MEVYVVNDKAAEYTQNVINKINQENDIQVFRVNEHDVFVLKFTFFRKELEFKLTRREW